MSRSLRRLLTLAAGAITVVAAGPGLTAQAGSDQKLGAINHILLLHGGGDAPAAIARRTAIVTSKAQFGVGAFMTGVTVDT